MLPALGRAGARGRSPIPNPFPMAYGLSHLSTKAMCDRATAFAQPVKDDLDFQLSQVVRHNALVAAGATTITANFDAATAKVTAPTASVAAMATGDTREKYERKLRRATEHKNLPTDRQGDFDGRALTAALQHRLPNPVSSSPIISSNYCPKLFNLIGLPHSNLRGRRF